uniref:Uncharacterized protein n=1 Tax=viral metagenome TaxID=1070528 RepID=A0A6C0M0X6_9ZZZZ
MGYARCNIDYSEKKKVNTTPMIWQGFMNRHYTEFLEQINMDPTTCGLEIAIVPITAKRPPDVNHNRVFVQVAEDGILVADPKTG